MKRFRLYYDKDAEERWLREMSAQGWALKNFFLGVYTFAPCEPNEYQYQIDLMKDRSDYDDYCQFMEDSGVEVVCRWVRWVYLRKRTEGGPFQMYTDRESKIEMYTRIRRFFQVCFSIELVCFLMELVNAIVNRSLGIGLLSLLMGVVAMAMLRIIWMCDWKIRQLKEVLE